MLHTCKRICRVEKTYIYRDFELFEAQKMKTQHAFVVGIIKEERQTGDIATVGKMLQSTQIERLTVIKLFIFLSICLPTLLQSFLYYIISYCIELKYISYTKNKFSYFRLRHVHKYIKRAEGRMIDMLQSECK